MRHVFSLVALLCALATFALPGRAASPEEDVQTAYAAWDTAFNAADPAALGALYTEEAVFLPPTHEVLSGPAGVASFFGAIFDAGVRDHHLELIETRENGDLVIAAARWSATGQSAAGADEAWSGLATHVFQRQPDGGLKLMLHTFN